MTKFTDLNLDAKVLKAVAETGYDTPTPIQAGAIAPALEGRDVLGIAQTGTGKTAAFTLPMITLLGRGRARARMPRSLILAPTRELAAQVAENFDAYAKYTKLSKALLIGGTSFKDQDKLIDKGVDVLIATPGRLLDHLERGKLILTDVKIMVVDEADRMLDMGFIPDIEEIFKRTPFTRQTLFFSATMAPEIERITNTFLSNPAKVEVARAATTNVNIKQGVVMFKGSSKPKEPSEKRELLRKLIDAEGEACSNAIIFCNRKSDVDIVAKSLNKYGYQAAPIHGDLDQSHRTKTLDRFRDNDLRILVASDVAARGLDIPAVTHVFNFDVPSHAEDYVHRIGRTGRAGGTLRTLRSGRAGRSGTAIMICAPRDEKNLEDVERLVKTTIPRLDSPMGKAAPAAAPAEAEKTEERPKRTRNRRKTEPKVEETKVEQPKPVEAQPAPAPEAKVEAKPEERPEWTQKPREDRNRGGRGRGPDRRDNGPKIVGMGDDTPAFIALSFADRAKDG